MHLHPAHGVGDQHAGLIFRFVYYRSVLLKIEKGAVVLLSCSGLEDGLGCPRLRKTKGNSGANRAGSLSPGRAVPGPRVRRICDSIAKRQGPSIGSNFRGTAPKQTHLAFRPLTSSCPVEERDQGTRDSRPISTKHSFPPLISFRQTTRLLVFIAPSHRTRWSSRQNLKGTATPTVTYHLISLTTISVRDIPTPDPCTPRLPSIRSLDAPRPGVPPANLTVPACISPAGHEPSPGGRRGVETYFAPCRLPSSLGGFGFPVSPDLTKQLRSI